MRKKLAFLCLTASTSSWALGTLLEVNRGQFPEDVRFVAKAGGVSSAITAAGFEFRRGKDQLSVRFIRAGVSQCDPNSPVASEVNYLDHNPRITHVPEYSSVVCHAIYPGVDWTIHASGDSLEHDWTVAPGAGASAIAMQLDSTTSGEVTSDGMLLLRSGDLTIRWKKPVAWQQVGKTRREVSVGYVVRDHRISLSLGLYRRDLPLTIDPVIDFSYVIAGSGDDRICQVALDAAGNIYIAGLTLSPDFQTSAGAALPSPVPFPGSFYQAFVQKLSPDGAHLIYSTYVGLGELYSDHPMGMRVDPAGNVYVAINIFNETTPAGSTPIDPDGGVGVVKIAPPGDRLIYSTRVLSVGYTEPIALAIDNLGAAYVAGGSTSVNIVKVDPSGHSKSFIYGAGVGKYFGGIADVAVGPDGSVYLAGTTGFSDLQTTPGSLKPTTPSPQNYHGYLLRAKPDGSGLIFCTYIGGDFVDNIYALTVDATGAAYVGGSTTGEGSFAGLQGTLLGIAAPISDVNTAFVTKVSPAGDAAVFTSLLPGASVAAIALDAAGNVYTAGAPTPGGGSYNNSDFPNPTAVPLTKIDPTGQKLFYYSAIPSIDAPKDNVSAAILSLAVDSAGAAYVAGSSGSVRVPEPQDIAPVSSNGFVVKIDPSPDQNDLELIVQSSPSSYVPGSLVSVVFAIRNNGSGPAQNVIFTVPKSGFQGGLLSSCKASGSGVCSQYSSIGFTGAPRVAFDSIPAGATETVTLVLNSFLSPITNILIAPVVATSNSDVNQANNTTAAVIPPDYVPVTVNSYLTGTSTRLFLTYKLTGVSTPAFNSLGSISLPAYAAPNSQVQLYWPSPQLTQLGGFPAVFQSWSDGNTDNPRTFTATQPGLNLRANFQLFSTPYLSAAGVTSAASYVSNGVSPGEIVALFGFNLGVPASGQVQNGAFTTSLGSAAVLFDGIPAPLIYAGGLQSSVIVPYEVAGKTSTNITVRSGADSYSTQVPVVAAVPALFTANTSGTGQAAALNQDLSVNSPSNPANPGDIVVLYGTGEGLINPVPANGTISGSPAPAPLLPVTVTIGNQLAEVTYAGEAPSLTAGVIQMNVRLPAGIQHNLQVPVSWSAGTFTSQPGTTIAVR